MQCRLCGSTELRLAYSQGNADQFGFHRCAQCSLVSADALTGTDQEKYARTYLDPRDEQAKANRAQSMTYRFLRRHVPRPGRLLEIGCGNGRLLYLARQDGWIVQGLEMSPLLAQGAHACLGLDVGVGDFLAGPAVPGTRHELLVLRHVLEHLPDPLHAMHRIHDLLTDDGCALLEFPNIDALDLRAKRWLQRTQLHRHHYPDDYRPGHCVEFCRRSFAYLLQQTRFELLHWETYSYRPISNWLYNRWHVGNKARVIIRKHTGLD